MEYWRAWKAARVGPLPQSVEEAELASTLATPGPQRFPVGRSQLIVLTLLAALSLGAWVMVDVGSTWRGVLVAVVFVGTVVNLLSRERLAEKRARRVRAVVEQSLMRPDR